MQVGGERFSFAIQPRQRGKIREGPMKILTTSALAAILSIAAPALSQAQETMTKEKLVVPGNSFLSKQLLVIRLAIPSENIRVVTLKLPQRDIG
jgi:hypothetical protein